jgi:hypothetical protein
MILTASNWKDRESQLSRAYECLASLFNGSLLTEALPTGVEPFFSRPFLVISQGRFSEAIVRQIEDSELREFAQKHLIGSAEFFSDSTDMLEDSSWFPHLVKLYC